MTDLAVLTPETSFKFFGVDVLKAFEAPDGKRMLSGVASSTTRDLHGDVILRSALDDMERTAKGMTIFRNHSYNVPDDIMGTVTKAWIKTEGVDHDGNPNESLHFEIEMDEDNPHAIKSWTMIKNKRRLGLSIGAMIPEGGAKRQKDGTYVIEHVNLLETSIVGIPANPKSWVDYAASALRGMAKSKTHDLGSPTLTLDGDMYRIEGSLNGLQIADGAGKPPEDGSVEVSDLTMSWSFEWLGGEDKVRIIRSITDKEGNAFSAQYDLDPTDPDDVLVARATVGDEGVQKATVWVETRDGDKITIGEPEGTADVTGDGLVVEGVVPAVDGLPVTNDTTPTTTDPDVQDAKVRVIEVDTDDGGKGSSDGEPDDVSDDAPNADVTADGEPPEAPELLELEKLAELSNDQLRVTALTLSEQLGEMYAALTESNRKLAEALGQRDGAIEAAVEMHRRCAEVLELVAKTPLGSKTQVKDARKLFSTSVASYYGEEMAQLMARSQSAG